MASEAPRRGVVIHVRHKMPGDTYIGRGSKWGNPFRIGNSITREKAIELYREWIIDQPELMAALSELRGKRLACYCAPKPCHGDVLVELLEAADGA